MGMKSMTNSNLNNSFSDIKRALKKNGYYRYAGKRYLKIDGIYHKWTFKSKMYTQIIGDLVLETRIDFGFVGYYNKNFKTPFERFDIGGDGLSNVYYYGTDFVPMRGYDASALTPEDEGGAFLYDKFSMELRYPLALKQETTIYVLAFAEAANAWMEFKDFNPFDIKRSAGGGRDHRAFHPDDSADAAR